MVLPIKNILMVEERDRDYCLHTDAMRMTNPPLISQLRLMRRLECFDDPLHRRINFVVGQRENRAGRR